MTGDAGLGVIRLGGEAEIILHDLGLEDEKRLLPEPRAGLTIFSALPKVSHCRGCFGCWVKTPGRCVIGDRAAGFATLMAKHDRLTIVSRLVFGSLSPEVKAIIDRSIGFVLPFLEDMDGRMIHHLRYPKNLALKYLFYGQVHGPDMETALDLVKANQRNFKAPEVEAHFMSSLDELRSLLAKKD
jgi:multimeric flavodoxin WrbA